MPNTKKLRPVVIEPDSKIVVLKQDNPYREGTAVHRRVRAVLSSTGKPVKLAMSKGARTSTIRALVREGLVRLSAPKSGRRAS